MGAEREIMVEKISPGELEERIEKGEDIYIFDFRTDGSYENSKEKIKNSLRLNFEDIEGKINEYNQEKLAVTYCT